MGIMKLTYNERVDLEKGWGGSIHPSLEYDDTSKLFQKC